jgi:hypothetical protein
MMLPTVETSICHVCPRSMHDRVGLRYVTLTFCADFRSEPAIVTTRCTSFYTVISNYLGIIWYWLPLLTCDLLYILMVPETEITLKP